MGITSNRLEEGARLRYALVLAAAIAMVAACRLLSSLPFGRAFDDLLFLLDGSYRISLGQIPHVDFASPLGPLVLYAMWAGEALFPTTHPFIAYHGIFWLVFLPFTVIFVRRLGTRSFLAAFALFALIMLLPMTLDDTDLSEISYFASYNRFASALLFLIGLWYMRPKGRLDGLWLAGLFLLLVLIKISAALVAFGIVLVACLLGRCAWRTAGIRLCLDDRWSHRDRTGQRIAIGLLARHR